MKIIKIGTTRTVILIRSYAIKIPKLYSWKTFLIGLLSNMQEKEFSSMKDNRICPVIFYIYGGFLLVMPRCKSITEEEFKSFNYKDFSKERNEEIYMGIITYKWCKVPVENKIDSFGWLDGRIVAIDYGS